MTVLFANYLRPGLSVVTTAVSSACILVRVAAASGPLAFQIYDCRRAVVVVAAPFMQGDTDNMANNLETNQMS